MAKKQPPATQVVFGMDAVLEEHARRIEALARECRDAHDRLNDVTRRLCQLDELFHQLAGRMEKLQDVKGAKRGEDD